MASVDICKVVRLSWQRFSSTVFPSIFSFPKEKEVVSSLVVTMCSRAKKRLNQFPWVEPAALALEEPSLSKPSIPELS